MLKNIIGKLSQLERSNNKCYTSAFRYIYIYRLHVYIFTCIELYLHKLDIGVCNCK